MAGFKFEGFVLGARDWKEKDKLIVFFTESKGKIAAIGRGTRSIKSKRLGSLQTGSFIKGIAFAKNKNSLPVLGETKLLQPLPTVKNLQEIGGALYLGEILNAILPENDPAEKAYRLFAKTIRSMGDDHFLDRVIKFSIELPRLVGFGVNSNAEKALAEGNLPLALELAKNYIANLTGKKIKSSTLIKSFLK